MSALPNLLPAPEKAEARERRIQRRVQGAVAVAGIVLLTLTGILFEQRSAQEKSLQDLEQQVRAFESSAAYHTYNILKHRMKSDQKYLDQIREAPSFFSLHLKTLSRLTPASIKLTDFDYNPQDSLENVVLRGVVESGSVPPEVMLAEYVETLAASPFYQEVNIARHVKRAVRSAFAIEFKLKLRAVIS